MKKKHLTDLEKGKALAWLEEKKSEGYCSETRGFTEHNRKAG